MIRGCLLTTLRRTAHFRPIPPRYKFSTKRKFNLSRYQISDPLGGAYTGGEVWGSTSPPLLFDIQYGHNLKIHKKVHEEKISEKIGPLKSSWIRPWPLPIKMRTWWVNEPLRLFPLSFSWFFFWVATLLTNHSTSFFRKRR